MSPKAMPYHSPDFFLKVKELAFFILVTHKTISLLGNKLYVQMLSTNYYLFLFKNNYLDFPGGPVIKNPPANTGDMGLSPGPGRSHMPWSN